MARKLKSGIVGQAQVIFGGAIGMNLGTVKNAGEEVLAVGMAELKERIKERDAQQKIDFDDVDPNHLVHEHIDPPTFEEAQGEKKKED